MKEIKGLKSIRDSFKTRQFKYGGYAALITLAVIVGLILINLIVGQFSPQIDMTKEGLFSLTEQTYQVIDEIKTPTNFYGLWRPGEEIARLPEIIDLYTARNRNIRLEVFDPAKNPGLTARFDKTNQGIPNGSLVVEGEKGFKVITPSDMYEYSSYGSISGADVAIERRITAALLFVATGVTPVIYEIIGHQEILLEEMGLLSIVERENFSVKQINLNQSSIPEDASIVLLNSPYSDLTRSEADRILDFLEKGGRFFVLADYRMRELTMLNEVMASYGMRFDFGVLHENSYFNNAGDPVLAVPDLLEHDINQPLIDQRFQIFMPYSMGISGLTEKRRTVEVKNLLSSSNNSFLRTDIDDNSATIQATDISGPIITGMTATDPSWIDYSKPEPQARIVAIACGSLVEAYQYNPVNIDLFMNSITWLEDRPETLSIRSKGMFQMPMSISGFEMILYGIIIVIVIPLGFFVAGFVTWLRRRHL